MGVASSQPESRRTDRDRITIPATPVAASRQYSREKQSPTSSPPPALGLIPEIPLTKAERKARRAAIRQRKEYRRNLKADRIPIPQSTEYSDQGVDRKDWAYHPAAAPPKGALVHTSQYNETPARMQDNFAIDPSLQEAEGTVHTAPPRASSSEADNQKHGSGAPTAHMHASFEDGQNIDKMEPLLQAATLASAQVERHKSRPDSDYVPAQQLGHSGTPAEEEQGNQGKKKKRAAKRGRKKKGQEEQTQADVRSVDDVDSVLGAEEPAAAGGQPTAPGGSNSKSKKRSRKRARAEQADGEDVNDDNENGTKRPRLSEEDEGGPGSSKGEELIRPSGPFTKHEWSKVEVVVENFKNRHSLDQRGVNDHIQSTSRQQTEDTKELWSELYETLDHRQKVAVMRACRRRYNNYEARGKWTAEEDDHLRQVYHDNEGKWVKIGGLCGRMPEDCRDRWRNYLACSGTRKIDDWNEREEMELQQAVFECADAIEEATRKKAKEEGHAFREQDWLALVNFNIVSEKLGHTRSRLQCYTHWRVMQRRPENQKIRGSTRKSEGASNRQGRALANFRKMLPGDKYQILSLIANKNSQRADEIPWKQIHRENPDNRWTTRDRKEAFAKLKSELTPDEPHLPTAVDSMLRYFEQTYPGQLDDVSPPEAEKRSAKEQAEEEDEAGDPPPYDLENHYPPDVSQAQADGTAANGLYPRQAAVAEMQAPAAATSTSTAARKPKKSKARGSTKKPSKKSKETITEADDEAAEGYTIDDSEDERRKMAAHGTASRPNGPTLADHLLAATSLPNPYQARQPDDEDEDAMDVDNAQQQAADAATEGQEEEYVETAGYPEHLAAPPESDRVEEEPLEDTTSKARTSKKSKLGGKKKAKSKSKA